MRTLLETVATYLQNEGWNFDTEPEHDRLVGYVNGDNATWQWLLTTLEDDENHIVRIYSNLPVNIPEGRRLAIAELITRINDSLGSGHFEMDFADGQVCCKTMLNLMDGTLTKAMFMRIFMLNLTITEQNIQTIMGVAFGGMEPAAAMEMQEAEGEVLH